MSKLLDKNRVEEDWNTFVRLKRLSKNEITSELKMEMTNFKSEIANGFLPLLLRSVNLSQASHVDEANNYYCIDLRATSHILPPRLKGEAKSINETTRRNRAIHEKEITQGKIACYKATDDGKLVVFEPRSNSKNLQDILTRSFARQIYSFTFPKLEQQNFSTYNVKFCAHPKCSNKLGKEEDHLQLCQIHHEKLMYDIEHRWLQERYEKIYSEIKYAGEQNSEKLHNRIYFQLLPQLNVWIKQIDCIIPIDCTGIGTQVPSGESWLVLQLRPVRQLLILMKSAIFLYRMHLNSNIGIIAALIALIIQGLQSDAVQQAVIHGYVRIIRTICSNISAIFAYMGIGILYTLDLIFTDHAYIAIILQTFGAGLAVAGTAAAVIVATPVAVIGGIAAGTVGLAMFLIGRRMEKERDNRGAPHPHLIQVHLDLQLARERLWQWIGDGDP